MIAAVPTETPEQTYQQSARALLQDRLATHSPAPWLESLRLQAMSQFETLGFPNRRQEAWKYINIRPVMAIPLGSRATANPDQTRVCPPALQRHLLEIPETDLVRLVFINGEFRPDLSITASAAAGSPAIICPLHQALKDHAPLVQAALGSALPTENDALAALNTALFRDGVFIHVPDHTTFQPLVQLVYAHFGEERRTTQPRNLIVLGKQARLDLVIEHLGLSQAVCFNNSVNEFLLDDGAQANGTLVLSDGPQGWHLASSRSTLKANARLTLNTVSLSGQVNRHSIQTLLTGEGAHVHLNGLDVLDGRTETYHHTVTEHWVPNCTGDQLYKSILDDHSKSEFNSLVFVAQGADGTDSHQLNKTLMLSEDARVWTRPQLQINADDVKCAHGAAVGQLDETQLFYLASRGLSPNLAQSLLTYGFAEEIIQRIANPHVRQYLEARVLNNLHRADASLKQQLGA